MPQVVTAFESLVKIEKGHITAQFAQRVPALAAEVGVELTSPECEDVYDSRSALVHGGDVDLSQPRELNEFGRRFNALQEALRRVVRRAIEDASKHALAANYRSFAGRPRTAPDRRGVPSARPVRRATSPAARHPPVFMHWPGLRVTVDAWIHRSTAHLRRTTIAQPRSSGSSNGAGAEGVRRKRTPSSPGALLSSRLVRLTRIFMTSCWRLWSTGCRLPTSSTELSRRYLRARWCNPWPALPTMTL
jgi:hypothetical protein